MTKLDFKVHKVSELPENKNIFGKFKLFMCSIQDRDLSKVIPSILAYGSFIIL